MNPTLAAVPSDIVEPQPTNTGLMPRATVEALVGKRNLAIALFGEAIRLIVCLASLRKGVPRRAGAPWRRRPLQPPPARREG